MTDRNIIDIADQNNKPILVTGKRARAILDIRSTKFWAMVKSGKIKMADTGGRRMVVYASLEALVRQ